MTASRTSPETETGLNWRVTVTMLGCLRWCRYRQVMVSARLRIPEPGPGYVHLPEWCDAEFLAQLTAEREVKRYQKGVSEMCLPKSERGLIAASIKDRISANYAFLD